jgi:hypothetical protein
MNAFRRRGNADSLGLPTTSGNAPKSRFGFSTPGSGNNNINGGGGGMCFDGSAASIHLQSPVVRAIKKSSRSVRISYGALAGCVLLMWSGYRWIRSQNASVWLTCHKQECHLQITPQGFRTTVSLHMARRQVIQSLPVKTTNDGIFLSDTGITLQEDWKGRKNKKSAKGKSSSNYKGPDENGHYLSYAIVLRDLDRQDGAKSNNETSNTASSGTADEDGDPPERDNADLKSILPYLNPTDVPGEYRLILRKFRLAQSKRRVRTMIQKIDSYIKKRRHKLVLKENAPPSWQGILICIVGLIGFCLSLLLGQFWDDPPKGHYNGPGVRRNKKPAYFDHVPVTAQAKKTKAAKQKEKQKEEDSGVYQTQTPSRYEVPVGSRPVAGMRQRN